MEFPKSSAPSRTARTTGGGLTARTPTQAESSLLGGLPELARCLHTNEGTNLDWETSTIFPAPARTGGGFDVAHPLRADGFDASEDGTGRGTPLVPVAMHETGQGFWQAGDIAGTLRAEGENRPSRPSNVVAVPVAFAQNQRDEVRAVAGALAAEPGMKQQTYIAIQNATRGQDQNGLGIAAPGEPMFTLDQGSQHAIAFSCKDHGADADADAAPTLRAMGHSGSHANAGGQIAVMTLAIRGRGESHDLEYRTDGTANAILTPNGGRAGIGVGAVAFHNRQDPDVSGDVTHPLGAKDNGLGLGLGLGPQMLVRRLTPVECARLQGFPDNYLSQVIYRGKKAADGPMYKALGNSFAVPVVRWIGQQIQKAVA